MEKEDIISLVAGIAIVIIVAFVVKPMVQGETPGQAIPGAGGEAGVGVIPTPTVTVAPAQTPMPTPTPTWDGKPREIGFVDPGSYSINISDDPTLQAVKFPTSSRPNNKMTTYAEVHGEGSGTTEIIHIPYPYWELWYDADPYNTEYCFFNVQVMDANDPNRFVRILSHPYTDFKSGNVTRGDTKSGWTEQFYEGSGDYWFVINTRCIRSYDLEIMVPERYVGPEET
ncbi:hypothetical protein E2N92_12855 [Methanofollis formosanus]|uniref:Uncharacterized protein n=1 Tax=Methanofollis formosanus TaxID=299308 RepID=A0A8G1A319_9EURY|nr:hypothetical protein [Methanofollis formosanus]QYZ80257.1 hypothetical protein E2N92_12855 [Methanofollis formosanus]